MAHDVLRSYNMHKWCRTPMGDETYSFPFDHVHWLCNSLFMMHVITPSASWRDPLPPTGFSAIVRRGAP